jgi:uncharacterized protein YndB with AHSA1/START domain
MAFYHFVTVWQVRAPIERVWDAIYHSDRWPQWWKGVVSATTLEPPDERGLGGLTRYVWKSALPYELVIDTTATHIDKPRTMTGRSAGELEGEGRWFLDEEDGLTTVRYEWDVRTTRPWMNLLAPLMRPAFEWNHDVVMRQGGEGLRELLEAPPAKVPGFDPDRLASLETAIWRAYYDRRWPAVLWLTLKLVHEQFGLSWPRAIEAAYYTTRAAIAWAPVKHDVGNVRDDLRRFYRVARRYGRGFRFDPALVAEQELEYWIVHRELSGKAESDKAPLERSLAELHAQLFGISVQAAGPSGVARARAADAVDEITGRRSRDEDLDWARVERFLRDAYRAIAEQLAATRRLPDAQ